MTAIYLLYAVFPSEESAISAARALLERRLAACANVGGGMTSLFRWQGEIRQETETALLAKTRKEKVEEAVAAIKALHPYELPCIIATPVAEGYAPFLQWVADETV